MEKLWIELLLFRLYLPFELTTEKLIFSILDVPNSILNPTSVAIQTCDFALMDAELANFRSR